MERRTVVHVGLRDCAFCRVACSVDSGEPDIRLERVTKRFGDMTAVDALDLEIPRGAFYALLGPSGCGKTTTLRMIGGFEEPDRRPRLPRRRRRHRAPALQARRQHGLPVLRAVPPSERRAQRRLRARAAEGRPREVRKRVGRGARPGPARPLRQAQARPALRRPGSSASRSPGRSSTARARCCSTSRSARSTCGCASSCRSSSSASSRTSASPSCTSRTTRRRP